MKIAKIIPVSMLMAASTNASAALIERLGGLAYYDDVANVTWLADANVLGPATWYDAMNWAAGLNVAGVTGWRLPNYIYGGTTTASELGNMFYNVLGGTSMVPIGVSHNSNYDLFSNIVDARYWFAQTENYCEGDAEPCAVVFNMNGGFVDGFRRTLPFYAWAVHDGDAVPLPAAIWLFASGLVGLGVFSRRKKL